MLVLYIFIKVVLTKCCDENVLTRYRNTSKIVYALHSQKRWKIYSSSASQKE